MANFRTAIDRQFNYPLYFYRGLEASAVAGIDKVFKAEGGYQADPADTANYVNGQLIGTNHGISALAYYGYYGQVPTVDSLKALTKEQARPIYKQKYWDKIQGDKINNQSIADLMMQYVVGSGVGSIKNIKVLANSVYGKNVLDNKATPLTSLDVDFINKLPQKQFFDVLWQFRKSWFEKIAKDQPSKAKFLKGWLNRLNTHKFIPQSNDTGSLFTRKNIIIGGGIILIAGAVAYRYKDKIKLYN